MTITAAQLAQLLDGTVEGDPTAAVTRPARIEEAEAGDFAFLDSAKYESYAYTTKASILLVGRSFMPVQPIVPTLVRVDDVRTSLALLLHRFDGGNYTNGMAISEKASIHESARIGLGTSIGDFTVVEEGAVIGNNCVIYPQVYIGRNARIGDNTRLYPGVRIHYDCAVGNHCILHANAVIGADGSGLRRRTTVPGPKYRRWAMLCSKMRLK